MKVFYINVIVDDASVAVFDKVHSTLVDDKKLPGPKKFRRVVGKVIANRAASSIPPKAIAKRLSDKIPKLLMYKTAQKGLKLYACVREESVCLLFLCLLFDVTFIHCTLTAWPLVSSHFSTVRDCAL